MRYQHDLIARNKLRVHARQAIRRHHIKQLALMKADVFRRKNFVQKFVHNQTTAGWSNRSSIGIFFANDNVTKIRRIERTQVFHFNIGPAFYRTFEELRVIKLRVITQNRQSYSAMTCHRIDRNFVSARATHLQLFSKATLGLQTDSGIDVSSRKIQDDVKAIEFCSARLANTAADDVTES